MSKLSSEENHPLLLIIDGVNQFSPTYGCFSLDWLPSVFPSGVRCIISTTAEGSGVTILKCLRLRERSPPFYILESLSVDEKVKVKIKTETHNCIKSYSI